MATSMPTLGRHEVGRSERLLVAASRAALLGLVSGFGLLLLAGGSVSTRAQLLAYLVGMVGLNLPHGGYEHATNLRRRGLPFGARYVAGYLALVVAFGALFLLAPAPALALAFATAVAKGGHRDLRAMDALTGSDHLRIRPQRVLAAVVRGGAVMVVPLVFWTGTFYSFVGYMLSVFDGRLPAVAAPDAAVPVLGTAYALAVAAHLLGGVATGGVTRSWLVDVGETLLLVAYFAVVPVVVAIGLYFPLWYSLRQSARAAFVERAGFDGADRDAGLSRAATLGVLVAGALVTGALAAGLWVVAPNPLGNATLLSGVVAFYTIFVCVVALPHVVVGEWLDVDRGIWYVP